MNLSPETKERAERHRRQMFRSGYNRTSFEVPVCDHWIQEETE